MTKRIGLEIGPDAVRAAAVRVGRPGPKLVRFAQVPLPEGAVEEGQVCDLSAVAGAIRRLWRTGHFRGRSVVVGIHSPRAMVRVVDLPPALAGGDLRSAVRLAISDLLPATLGEVVFDAQRLQGEKVLVAATPKLLVYGVLSACRRAGLRARAVDLASLALFRAVPSSVDEAVDAIVSVDRALATVAVRRDSMPVLVRTTTIRDAQPASPAAVEQHGYVDASLQRVMTALAAGTDPLIDEVHQSVRHALGEGSTLARLSLVGTDLPEGLSDRLADVLGCPVAPADLGTQTATTAGEQQAISAGAVGLALRSTGDGTNLDLFPPELVARRSLGRAATAGAVCALAAAAGLGYMAHTRDASVRAAHADRSAYSATAAGLSRRLQRLDALPEVEGKVASERQLATSALAGDVDWVGLDHRILAALPRSVSVTSLSLTSQVPATTGATTSSKSATYQGYVGQVTIDAQTTNGIGAVSTFVSRLARVKGLAALWVGNESGGEGGHLSFSADALVTRAALGNRAASIPGGVK